MFIRFSINYYTSSQAMGIYINNQSNNVIIRNNRIHSIWNIYPTNFSGAFGININSSSDVLIANNEIFDIVTTNYSNSNTNYNPFGIRITNNSNNVKIWNNSINLYGTQQPNSNYNNGTVSSCVLVSGSLEVDIQDNVFSNTLNGLVGTFQACICFVNNSYVSNMDYNDYYFGATYGRIGYYYNQWFSNLIDWQDETGRDFNSISELPNFTSNDNLFPLENSPLIAAGTYINNNPYDLLGNQRPLNPTIGAYEYNYVVQLISPENNSNNIYLIPFFQWKQHGNADYYNIQIATNSNFSNIVFEESNILDNYYQISSSNQLESNTDYFWRVQAVVPNGSNYWSNAWKFTTQYLPWLVNSNTGNSSTIIVPTSINPMLGDRPFAEGDAIGLFYQNDENEWQCAGYGIWNGQNLGITVWGDNPDTPIKDGFAVGETYTFKVWDAVLGQEWNATATYQEGPDNYQISGFSVLTSLNVNIPIEQNISLNFGWNIISSYIEPVNDTIPNVFSDLFSNLKIVKNGAGEMYDPAFGINDIVNWNYTDGYLVNMLNNNELTISGQKLVPETTPINLNNGWNLSAYLRDNDIAPTTALESISSSLVLAKDNVGGIYSPAYGINTIGNMQAGQGYYFYMNATAELTYPANSAQKAVAGNEITPLAKYNIPTMKNTGKNATLLISIENNDGNEIGVYNMNNELIGSGAVYNGVAAITIWGDDDATQTADGAKDNEYLNVKLYNTTNNTSKEISLTQIKEITGNTEQNQLYYKTNSIYLAKASAHNESGFAMSIKNIPNPVESNVVFEFSLTDEANAEIQIYSSTGELVAKIGNNVYSAGLHRISFDASNLANGMYNIVLSSGARRVTSFMVVNK